METLLSLLRKVQRCLLLELLDLGRGYGVFEREIEREREIVADNIL